MLESVPYEGSILMVQGLQGPSKSVQQSKLHEGGPVGVFQKGADFLEASRVLPPSMPAVSPAAFRRAAPKAAIAGPTRSNHSTPAPAPADMTGAKRTHVLMLGAYINNSSSAHLGGINASSNGESRVVLSGSNSKGLRLGTTAGSASPPTQPNNIELRVGVARARPHSRPSQ